MSVDAETIRLELGGAEVRALPGAERWVRSALRTAGSLYEAAAAEAVERLRGGRGPAYVISPEPRPWVVRHYRRGGAVAGLMDDRYLRLARERPFREMAASRALRAAGLPTPEVVAGAVYRAGLFYTADLVTERVRNSRSLTGLLADPDSSHASELIGLELAGALARRLAHAGVYHVDFNTGNVLIRTGPADSEAGAWVVDLDRCRTGIRNPEACLARMVRRMERSIAKQSMATGGGVDPAERWIAALRRGAELPEDVR